MSRGRCNRRLVQARRHTIEHLEPRWLLTVGPPPVSGAVEPASEENIVGPPAVVSATDIPDPPANTDRQVPSPPLGNNRLDVNGDGQVTHIDALNIINEIDRGGLRKLVRGEGEQTSVPFDVTGDGYLNAIDILQVVNYLNNDGQAVPAEEDQPLASQDGSDEDGRFLLADAELLVKELNERGPRRLTTTEKLTIDEPFVDFNNDGYLSPGDVLGIINFADRQSSGGESDQSEEDDSLLSSVEDPLELTI